MKNKKLILIISIVVGIILLSVGGFLLYKYIEIKNAVVKVVLKDNLEADFADTLRVSSFIESINGKIVDDYYLNTDSLGKKKIDFEYINDDGIKIKYSSGNVSKKKFILNVNEASSKKGSNGVKSVTEFSDVIKNYKNDNTQIGIDVSKWQGDIDFSKLKSAGVEFVIIRIGSSTGINGENFIDSKFIQNIKNANSVGIPVGVYFYSYANSVDKAISDAKWIIENIKDYKVELPIAFDWENWGSFNTYELSFFGLTNMAKGFMDTVKDAGYDAMLYSSKTYLENIWMSVDYPVWLAHYTKNTNYAGAYSYWQICSNGRVDGINGDVDIDIRYID